MKLKVNRKYSIDIHNIKKFVVREDDVLVYRKSGYPIAYKTDYNFYQLKLKLTNLGYKITDFNVEER